MQRGAPFTASFCSAALVSYAYMAQALKVNTYHPCCVCALGHMMHMYTIHMQVPVWYLPLTVDRLKLSALPSGAKKYSQILDGSDLRYKFPRMHRSAKSVWTMNAVVKGRGYSEMHCK